MTYGEIQQLTQDFALMLEKNTFEAAEKYLLEMGDKDIDKLATFKELIDLESIYIEISAHKISLAQFLAKSNGVKALDEDSTRVVFTLADNALFDLDTINEKLKEELGNNFRLLEKYKIGTKVKTWKEVALRAREIKTGLQNYASFVVLLPARVILDLYKARLLTDDVEEAKKLIILANEILVEAGFDPVRSPLNSKMSGVNEKVKNFYKLTNHLQADIEKLFQKESYDDILLYVYDAKLVLETKIFLNEHKIPLDDYKAVRNHLVAVLSKDEFSSRISYEELARGKKPLEKAAAGEAKDLNPAPAI